MRQDVLAIGFTCRSHSTAGCLTTWSSCAGLTRASITFAKADTKQMDLQVKPAGDGMSGTGADFKWPETGVIKGQVLRAKGGMT
jgi:hypothetical protein